MTGGKKIPNTLESPAGSTVTRTFKRCMDIDSLSVLEKQLLLKIIEEFELVKKNKSRAEATETEM